MDIANVHNVGGGEALAQTTVKAVTVDWRPQEYAWTHSAPVEGFFAVLTIVIVPVAILRWCRRLRSLLFVVGDRRHREANS